MELTPDSVKGVGKVHRIEIESDFIYVRTLNAQKDLDVVAKLHDDPSRAMQTCFCLLVCDETGKPHYPDLDGDLSDWPASVVARVVEEGMKLNSLRDDLEELKKK